MKSIWKYIGIILWILCVCLGIYHYVRGSKVLTHQAYEKGYLDACKDFYKGKIKYDLIENPDGTKEWKKVE